MGALAAAGTTTVSPRGANAICELVDMLLGHEEQYGKLEIPVEEVASFLLEE